MECVPVVQWVSEADVQTRSTATNRQHCKLGLGIKVTLKLRQGWQPQYAPVAQWIEYWPPKPRAGGSNPPGRAKIKFSKKIEKPLDTNINPCKIATS